MNIVFNTILEKYCLFGTIPNEEMVAKLKLMSFGKERFNRGE